MQELKISEIRTDGGTQPRAALDPEIIAEYADAMDRGEQFPPVDVMYDGDHYWLFDGFHRVKAAGTTDRTTIAAEVHQGTQQDAQWESLAANKKHGLRRSRADKQRAVKQALKGWGSEKSAREIARHVGVSDATVRRYSEEVRQLRTSSQKDNSRGKGGRVQGADGKWYPANRKQEDSQSPDTPAPTASSEEQDKPERQRQPTPKEMAVHLTCRKIMAMKTGEGVQHLQAFLSDRDEFTVQQRARVRDTVWAVINSLESLSARLG